MLFSQIFRLAALEIGDGFFQHGLVKLEPDLVDMAGLLLAQQVAGAADIEIVAGQRKARPERIQRLQDLQAFFRRRRQLGTNRQRKIGIGTGLGAPDPSAQLVKLRQPEPVSPVNDQRVGGGDVQPGLDNRRAQQHVILAVVEAGHDVFQLDGRHLPMGNRHFQLRNMLGQELGRLADVRDARTNIESLPAPETFAHQGFAQDHGVKRRHIGAHRQPVDWRGGNQ